MRRLSLSGLAAALLLLSACAPARTAPAAARPPQPVAAAEPEEAPVNWQLLDEAADRVPGLSLLRAERDLLAGKAPRRTVVVAVIDAGIDTTLGALRSSLWTNPREIRGNNRDDDGNGYVDDIYGWDFIGSRDGRSLHYDNLEVTRLYVRCQVSAKAAAPGWGTDVPIGDDGATCAEIVADFRKRRAEAERGLARWNAIGDTLTRAASLLRSALGGDSLTVDRVRALEPARADVRTAKNQFLAYAEHGISIGRVARIREYFTSRLEYWLNPSFEPRALVGDDYSNPRERYYGNADVVGHDPAHGTVVSAIVAAARTADTIPRGIAPLVRIMMIRTVADGDERDKDVANAIRYAVDNGAHIINMSFGKSYSPQKRVVDDAVRYADARGVLMVHAAGNEGADTDVERNYPSPYYADGGRAQHWIEVGASSWRRGERVVAPFSNYGRTRVDVFAPGEDILVLEPGGTSMRSSGTSLAAPMVAGLAALIMSYYPELTAADVKRVILDSATRRGTASVVRPGSDGDEQVPFASLSATGGIVNAYAALQLAARAAAATP